jgi:hypothetical protein
MSDTTREKLDYVMAFIGTSPNPFYRHVNNAIYATVKAHYLETLELARQNLVKETGNRIRPISA